MALTHEEKMTNTLIDVIVATARHLKAALPVLTEPNKKTQEINHSNETIMSAVNALQRLSDLPEYTSHWETKEVRIAPDTMVPVDDITKPNPKPLKK